MPGWPTLRHKEIIFAALGYQPNAAQLPIHASKARVIDVVGAERAGKSTVSSNEVIARMLSCQRVAFVADEYDHSRKEWSYVAEGLSRLGMMAPGASAPKRGAWIGKSIYGCEFMTISVNTGIQQLTGTGEPFDIIVICEAGLQQFNTFIAARGRVAETRGVVILSGTLWDNVGWYADMFRMGQTKNNPLGVESFSLPAWSNLALFPGGKDDPEILAWREALNDDDEAARRIDATVVASPARMYPSFTEIMHVKPWAEFDPTGDVIITVDSGWFPSRYAVLAAQFRKDKLGRETLILIDEVWEHHMEHEQIIARCQMKPWWENVTLAVGGHETKQHAAAKSTAEIWTSVTGLYFETYDAGLVLEGARRVRQLLNYTDTMPPRLFISAKCTGTAYEFQHYSRRTDRGKNVISQQPEDRNNDAMDAVRNLVVWKWGTVDTPDSVDDFTLTNPYG